MGLGVGGKEEKVPLHRLIAGWAGVGGHDLSPSISDCLNYSLSLIPFFSLIDLMALAIVSVSICSIILSE